MLEKIVLLFSCSISEFTSVFVYIFFTSFYAHLDSIRVFGTHFTIVPNFRLGVTAVRIPVLFSSFALPGIAMWSNSFLMPRKYVNLVEWTGEKERPPHIAVIHSLLTVCPDDCESGKIHYTKQ